MFPNLFDSVASFSPCRKWRYTLNRIWGANNNLVMFIGLNPSTADEIKNDPTVRRCIGYAQAWGYDGLLMTNIFAFRATDPNVMKRETNPIGEDNDGWLIKTAEKANLIVAAWGSHGSHLNRENDIKILLNKWTLKCLGTTAEGHPKHPLYLPKDAELTVWHQKGE